VQVCRKRWISDDAFEAFLTVVTRSRLISTKGMAFRCAKRCAEKRVTFRHDRMRHLWVVLRHVSNNARDYEALAGVNVPDKPELTAGIIASLMISDRPCKMNCGWQNDEEWP